VAGIVIKAAADDCHSSGTLGTVCPSVCAANANSLAFSYASMASA
jgi:hypothetical protein